MSGAFGWRKYDLLGGIFMTWDIYGLDEWGSCDKASCCYMLKIACLQESTLSGHSHDHRFMHDVGQETAGKAEGIEQLWFL